VSPARSAAISGSGAEPCRLEFGAFDPSRRNEGLSPVLVMCGPPLQRNDPTGTQVYGSAANIKPTAPKGK
jgi:hypothetical protein